MIGAENGLGEAMSDRFLDIRMNDGSRHFASLPQSVLWQEMKDHLARLDNAVLTGFVCDEVTEAWIDFDFRGHHFSINDQFGEYWFFVKEPACPLPILTEVAEHFELLLCTPPQEH